VLTRRRGRWASVNIAVKKVSGFVSVLNVMKSFMRVERNLSVAMRTMEVKMTTMNDDDRDWLPSDEDCGDYVKCPIDGWVLPVDECGSDLVPMVDRHYCPECGMYLT
jgi:hypothetical protein